MSGKERDMLMLQQKNNYPTEREKAFDIWVRMIISNGLNEKKPAIVYLENNQSGTKRLYESINRHVPKNSELRQDQSYTFFADGKRYATHDAILYYSLRKLDAADRQFIFMMYWENTKDLRMMQQLHLTKKTLKDRKREITERLINAVNGVS